MLGGIDMTIDRDAVNKLQNLDEKQFKEAVEKISKQLKLALNGVEYEVLTPTRYESGNI